MVKAVLDKVERNGNVIRIKWRLVDEEEKTIYEREATYIKDPDQPWPNFYRMIKQEEKAMINHMKKIPKPVDVSDKFKDLEG